MRVCEDVTTKPGLDGGEEGAAWVAEADVDDGEGGEEEEEDPAAARRRPAAECLDCGAMLSVSQTRAPRRCSSLQEGYEDE